MTVPIDAIEGTGSAAHVFVVRRTASCRQRPVTVGLETAQKVEILSGLEEGDMVIVGRHSGIERWPESDAEASRGRGLTHVGICYSDAVFDCGHVPDRGALVGAVAIGADAGGSVPRDEHSGGRGGDVLSRDAAGADRRKHHVPPGAVLHAGQRDRPHGIAVAVGRQPDQGLLPARHESGFRGHHDRQPGHGGDQPSAAGHAAAVRAEDGCVQPAGLPGDAEGRRTFARRS